MSATRALTCRAQTLKASGAVETMMPWGGGPLGWQQEEVIPLMVLSQGGSDLASSRELYQTGGAPKFLFWEVGARGKSCPIRDGWMPCVNGGPETHQFLYPPQYKSV